jgi:hypothetical protein
MTGPRWIRLVDLPDSGLSAQRVIHLLAIAMTELGLAQGLVLVHGREQGVQRYAAAGAIICFDAEGEPVIREDAEPRP